VEAVFVVCLAALGVQVIQAVVYRDNFLSEFDPTFVFNRLGSAQG